MDTEEYYKKGYRNACQRIEKLVKELEVEKIRVRRLRRVLRHFQESDTRMVEEDKVATAEEETFPRARRFTWGDQVWGPDYSRVGYVTTWAWSGQFREWEYLVVFGVGQSIWLWDHELYPT